MLDPLADDEHLAVEVDAGGAGGIGDEQLLEAGHHRPRAGAEAVGSTGTSRQPSTRAGPRRRRSPRSPPAPSRRSPGWPAGTPGRPRRRPSAGSGEAGDRSARKRCGTWMRMPAPSPVSASAPVAPRCSRLHSAPMPMRHQLAAAHAVDVGDERDATGVVFEPGVVQTRGRGKIRERMSASVSASTKSGSLASRVGWVALGTTLARTVKRMLRRRAPEPPPRWSRRRATTRGCAADADQRRTIPACQTHRLLAGEARLPRRHRRARARSRRTTASSRRRRRTATRPTARSGGGTTQHPQGTTILVLGILSLVVCGILGPFAWSMGNKALREINADPTARLHQPRQRQRRPDLRDDRHDPAGVSVLVIIIVAIAAVELDLSRVRPGCASRAHPGGSGRGTAARSARRRRTAVPPARRRCRRPPRSRPRR